MFVSRADYRGRVWLRLGAAAPEKSSVTEMYGVGLVLRNQLSLCVVVQKATKLRLAPFASCDDDSVLISLPVPS